MKRSFGIAVLTALTCSATALAGPEWIESGDAGSLPAGAQGTSGQGQLGGIAGSLGEALGGSGPAGTTVDTEDMYIVEIEDPSIFCATTSQAFGGFAEFDSRLFVYEITGLGVLGNDDTGNNPPIGGGTTLCVADFDGDFNVGSADLMILLRDWGPTEGSPADLNGDGVVSTEDLLAFLAVWGPCDQATASAVTSEPTDGSDPLTMPGLYLIAISEGQDPASINGAIFLFEVADEVSGPDGPGGGDPILAWEGSEEIQGGDYFISFCGTSFSEGEGPDLDIKPGGCPNPLNRTSHGVLPVALVGTTGFDATDVDIATLRLSRADGVGGLVAPNEGPPGPHTVFDDTATPFDGEDCTCHDLEGDGITDVMMHFRTDDVVSLLELDDLDDGTVLELVVTGATLSGESFSASDCVQIVPAGSGEGAVAIESNMLGIWVEATPLDGTIDGGGFANFVRHWPVGTVATLTAPAEVDGNPFVGWHVIGPLEDVWFPPDVLTVQVAVGEVGTMEAVYDDQQAEGGGR